MSKSIRSISIGAIFFVTLFFSFGAFALEPVDKWEGNIDYGATGAPLLANTEICGQFFNGTTYELTCYPIGTAGLADNYQGNEVLSESESFLGGLPADVNILKAYLVWMGSIDHETMTPDSEVYLTPPGGSAYPVKATSANLQDLVDPGYYSDTGEWYYDYHYFSYRVDVTDILRVHSVTEGLPLIGFYKVSGYEGYCDSYYKYITIGLGGWSLIIVYSDPAGSPKRVYFYESFQTIQDSEIIQTPSGFEVPEDPSAKVTFFLGEGDEGISGACTSVDCEGYEEGIFFNGTMLTDSCNPSDNAYNSTVNTNLNPSEGECRIHQYSIDLDTFDVSSLLSQGDTSAEVKLSLGGDKAFSNYIILSISTKLPNFDIPNEKEKNASIEDGENILPGEEFTYYIYVQNNGEDVAKNVKVKDELPSQVHYIPNSTYLVSPDGTRTLVPDPTTGTPPCYNGIAVANEMPADSSKRYTIEIGVKLKTLDEGINKDTVIENIAEIISGDGDVYFTNGGIPTRHGVKMESYEGKLNFSNGAKHSSSRFVAPGDTGVRAAHIDLSATNGNVSLVSMSFSPVQDTDASMISQASLYWDKNSNGIVESSDTLLSTTGWSANSLLFNDFTAIGEVEKDTTISLVLLTDISANSNAGSVAQVELTESGVTVRGFTSGLPFKSSKLMTPADDTDLSVEFGDNNPPDSLVEPGDKLVVAQLLFKSYTDGNSITGITFEANGTVYEPKEIEEVQLHSDLDGDGTVSMGDAQLGTTIIPTSDNQNLEFTGFNIDLNTGDSANVIVYVKFAEDAGTDKYFQISLSSETQINTGTSNILGTPLTGSSFTVSNEVQGCLTDNECQTQYGYTWYCDSNEGVCKDGGSSEDGDTDTGITDGDVDNGSGGSSETDGGGGCFSTSNSASSVLMLFALITAIVFIRRRRLS